MINHGNILFQYISCCSLSTSKRIRLVCRLNFNTSHVVVYPVFFIQISSLLYDFNTSHVVVYPSSISTLNSLKFNFNTSHVVVYQDVVGLRAHAEIFQYISCCSLSNAFPRFLFFHFTFRPDFSPFFRFLPSATPILFSMSSIA